MDNPFIFGDPVRGDDFLNRRRELRRLVGRIRKGHSSLISAEPRLGKTSLLLHLQETSLYGEQTPPLYFRFLDAQAMAGWDVSRFWREALRPVKSLTPELEEASGDAAREQFGTFVLERFFTRLERAGKRLVLLLDEFDAVLNIPGLHTIEFYGGLRTLTTLYQSLTLVIAARQTTGTLNQLTQEFSRNNSPYFNFMEEISLPPLPHKDVNVLLDRAKERFSRQDRTFLIHVSGRHPYFLQALASYLWDAYEEEITYPIERMVWAGEQCFNQASPVLKDTWRTWTPYQQMAFTLAALDAMPHLLPDREFDVRTLLKERPNLSPEQRILKQRGFLRAALELEGGYAPQGEIMLWFLAEELTSLLRPAKPDLKSWLSAQQWDGMLKKGEKESLEKVLTALKPALKEGVTAFIKAAAEGLGRGLTSGGG